MDLKVMLRNRVPHKLFSSFLYQYISTSSGLSEWFADNVNSRGSFYVYMELSMRKLGSFSKEMWAKKVNMGGR
jgi:hypothetical protein